MHKFPNPSAALTLLLRHHDFELKGLLWNFPATPYHGKTDPFFPRSQPYPGSLDPVVCPAESS